MRVRLVFVSVFQMQLTRDVTTHGGTVLCLLGYVSRRVEIGHDRGFLRTDVLGVKKKTIRDSRKTSWNAAWSLVSG